MIPPLPEMGLLPHRPGVFFLGCRISFLSQCLGVNTIGSLLEALYI